MPDDGPFAYSVAQLARAWGVSQRHVYDLCRRGELGHLRIGALIRIRQADREAYEARQWHGPTEAPAASSGVVNQVDRGVSAWPDEKIKEAYERLVHPTGHRTPPPKR